ncbi:MAG: hypothetical protein ACK5M3_16255 [Dysgonomonas sp.]
MITRNLKRWIALPLVLGAILYACQSEDSPDINTKQPVAPLTVATARSLYEQYVGTTAYLKNDDGSDNFNLIPDWNAGQLFSDSNWYVVESPLELGDGKELVFSTAEVKSHDEARPYSIVRQVVMRNKHTGLDYAFVMIVIPTWEYMQKGKDRLYGNQYLTRAGDLSGEVIFLDTKGEFINGWRYSNGEITHAMIVPEQQLKTVWRSQYCWHQDGYVGEKLISSNYTCIEWHEYDQTSIIDEGFTGDGEVNYTDPLGTGGNNGSPDNSPSDDKKPETRTDCSPSAAMNASNAQSVLNSMDIKVKIESLRINAKTNQKTEFGAGISYDRNFGTYSITGGEIAQGEPNNFSVGIPYTAYTAYTAHTHYTGLNAAPSGGDIIATVNFYKEIKAMGGNYKGTINFAADGSEYLIYVNDPAALEKFYKGLTNNDFFQRNGSDFKEGTEWQKEYDNSFDKLKKDGFSENDAQSYALSHILDKYNTGLKISQRANKTVNFKELKTATEGTGKNTKYKPQICPES